MSGGRIPESRFALVSNGFADGPAQALRDYLVESGASVVTVFHPLTREQGLRHRLALYRRGALIHERSIALPLRPPASFALDPFVPLRLPRVDAWFGFNCVACARGLVARAHGASGQVVYWCVDFVPDRFGRTPLTWAYDALDRLCARRADARFELSEAARDARNARHGFEPDRVAPAHVVPMGAWTARVPTAPESAFSERRVVFLGHLVRRQGVELLLEALARLRDEGEGVTAEIIGGGPLEHSLRRRAATLDLGRIARFHGFVEDAREVERMLARCSLAIATYEPGPGNFTRFADPGKLKLYLAAGLPIVLTPVPPNSSELAEKAGAELVPFDAERLAGAIREGLRSHERWQRRHQAARRYAERFDWDVLLPQALASLGYA